MIPPLKALGLALLCTRAQALYFYMPGPVEKCFFEDLPKDTLVVGHYRATEYDERAKQYVENQDMGVHITVDEVFDRDHRVVSQRGSSTGKFTFTAADAGEHRLCMMPSGVHHSWGVLASGAAAGGIRMELDLAIGATSAIERADKDKMGEVAERVRDVNARLQDVRREQVFQREREMEFRDQSESVNARVVRWTLVQMLVLAATCAWQLTYLRAFFIKQKLT